MPKAGTETKVVGTNLLRELNSSERIVTIDYKNSQSWFDEDKNNKAGTFNATDAQNGTGADAVISFDPDSDISIMTVDTETSNVSAQKRPNKIGLGHELIHAEHYMEGSYAPESDKSTHTFKMGGKTYSETYQTEELRTVGLVGNKKGDHTENQLRKENRLNSRGAYNTYKEKK